MNKSIINTFIKKYYLSGTVESVKLQVNEKEKSLKTHAITEDKNVLLNVTLNNFDALKKDIEIGVNDTSKLLKMIGVLNEEVKIEVIETNDKVTSMVFSDDDTDVQYVTADLTVIPVAPPLKKVPTFNAEILMNSEFVSKFISAKNALPDVSTFTLMMNKKNELELVLGYSSINTNRVKIKLKTNSGKDKVSKVIHFNANYLKEILSANKTENAVLKVSDAGLSHLEFVDGDFVSNYYMVEVKNID